MYFISLVHNLSSSTLDILAFGRSEQASSVFYGITFQMFEDAYLVPHHVLPEGKEDLPTSPSGGFWTFLSPGHFVPPTGYNAAGLAS